MQQLTVTSVASAEWQEIPEPTLTTTKSALVRPLAVATCDFDHLLVSGRAALPLPVAIGHECVAEVVEVGGEVTTVVPGDTVIVSFQIACGECAPCARGHSSCCERVPWLSCYGLGAASGGWGGAASDLLLIPYADAMLVTLPAGISAVDAAALSCNLPDAHRCVGPQLADRPGAPVLVVGGAFQNIAHYAVALAVALGSSRVDYHDRVGGGATRASTLGANVLDRPEDIETAAYPITVDASMDPELLALAIRATAADGVCTASTMYAQGRVELPLMTMFQRCLSFHTGQPHVRSHIEPLLAMMSDGRLDPGPLRPAVADWHDAPVAFCAGTGKTVITRAHSRRAGAPAAPTGS